jgi:protein disulfide-isomerase A6
MKLFGTVVCLAAFVLRLVAGGFYETGPVAELSAKTFKKEVLDFNGVSVVEFYAPWCGHCKNLAPEYIKAAKSLNGLVKVGAVNCDNPSNSEVCSKYEIKGFPTIKVFRPTKIDVKAKRSLDKPPPRNVPAMEDYNGAREGNAIANFALSRLRNYVTTITTQNVDKFFTQDSKTKVVVLAASKGKHTGVPPLLKVLSSDYLFKLTFGYVNYDQPDDLWAKFGQTHGNSHKLVIVPPEGDTIEYDGEFKKSPISEFLSKYIKGEKDKDKAKKNQKRKSKSALGASHVSSFEALEEYCLSKVGVCIILAQSSEADMDLFTSVPKSDKVHYVRFLQDDHMELANDLKLSFPSVVAIGEQGQWSAVMVEELDAGNVEKFVQAVVAGEVKTSKLPSRYRAHLGKQDL